MTTDQQRRIDDFMVVCGYGDAVLVPISLGRNNRVWRVEADERHLLLKSYRRRSGETWERLRTEYAFLEVLREGGVARVPEPIACSPDTGLGLYTLLSGSPVDEVTGDLVHQCVQFAVEVADCGRQTSALNFGDAADSYFNLADQVEGVRARLIGLAAVKLPEDIGRRYNDLVSKLALDGLDRVEEGLKRSVPSARWSTTVPAGRRILSPSDFGFHNAVVEQGQLSFFDFEYAGWDDPAKLICDFTCQPDYRIGQDLGQLFAEKLSERLDDPGISRRADLLMPLFRLRWCCIMLNVFGASLSGVNSICDQYKVEVLNPQLDRVIEYFDYYLAGV